MKWKLIFLSIPFLMTASVHAQQEKRAAVKGNNAYENESYDDAIEHYEQSLELKEDYYEGGFNMGNALHRKAAALAARAQEAQSEEEQQQLIEESGVLNQQAANRFEMMADQAETKTEKAKAYHNMGNAKLMSGDIEGSIESYKQALRNNPDDDETRYNLAYAKRMKEQQEQQQEQEQDEQEEEQDQEQDQNEQEQEQEQDSEQQEPGEEQEQQDGEEQQQQPEPNQLSHEDAQQMLEAIQKDEDEIQEKMKEKKSRAVQIEIEQDW